MPAPVGNQTATLQSISDKVHTGSETSCAQCHETGLSGRPHDTAGFLNLNAQAPFDYSSHAAGVDCIQCHSVKTIARTRADWANGYYLHTSSVTACISCHLPQMPGNSVTDLVRTGGVDHTTFGGQNCIPCHNPSLNTPLASVSDWSGASSEPTKLVYNVADDVNLSGSASLTPAFSNTTIVSVASLPQTIHMTMSHQATLMASSGLSTCTACHASGTYLGGKLHVSLASAGLSQPTACAECHQSSALPVVLVGSANPAPLSTRSPLSDEMRHDAVVWSANSSGAYVATSVKMVANDCAVCHSAPSAAPASGNGWNGAAYHSSLTSHGLSQPTSCLDCHANSRAVGPSTGTLTAFDHSTHANGAVDCAICHSVGSSWAGGVFHKNSLPAPTTCSACHATQRPNGTTATTSAGASTAFVGYDSVNKPFDVSSAQNSTGYHGGSRDCSVCHKPTTFRAMAKLVRRSLRSRGGRRQRIAHVLRRLPHIAASHRLDRADDAQWLEPSLQPRDGTARAIAYRVTSRPWLADPTRFTQPPTPEPTATPTGAERSP